MTTSRLSRLRKRVGRTTIDGVREKELADVGQHVHSFADIGGPSDAGGWIDADDSPALFERNPDELEAELTELWRRAGREQLLPLAGPIAQLAEHARKDPLRTERDVSSTVYALQ